MRKGFTLIELLVVVSIISTMSSVVLAGVQAARIKGRDSNRISQMRQVQLAVELYYANHGQYPSLRSTNIVQNWSDLLDLLRAEKLLATEPPSITVENTSLFSRIVSKLNPLHSVYALNTTIQDPLYPAQSYGYMPGDSTIPYQNFRIRSKLENINNPILQNGLSGKFLYTDADEVSYPQYSCAPLYGYYCIGPQQNISAGFNAFQPGKPVVYLYPQWTMPISVTVSPVSIEESIPEYKNGWNVVADPDGTITDPRDGKKYPYLYWEGASNQPRIDNRKGAVVKTSEIKSFLVNALQQQGLIQHEYDEFVEYWAPRMTTHLPYVYVYFIPQVVYDKLIPMTITPTPDTTIRVYMVWKALETPISVIPQSFSAPERKGFTVVEWGGDRSQLGDI